ncbi:hypothetical protein [Streptomyces sp. NPDC101776]|uniref:hypothetical protein n=1 Tax=Streptomyces sp. NPDC101776 TaxID=3366146 RepID=UPI00382AFC71
MSGTDLLVACEDAALTFGRDSTAVVAVHGTDRNANQAITPTDQQAQQTPELNDVRH